MRGFQPGAHLVPKYADGGLVQRALGLFGGRKKQIDEAVKVASQDTRQASAPAPAPVKTTQDGKFDEKRASNDNPAGIGFANGGMVRGPGTGTSDDVPDKVPEGTYIMPADSTQAIGPEALEELGEVDDSAVEEQGEKVPVRLSNGEFKLPPEQVHAIGVQALDQIKNATHKPVRGFAPQAAPEQPRQFFSNGGYVKRLHLADAGVVTKKRLEEEGRVPNAATSPSNIFPGNRLPGDSGSTSAPPPVAPPPSAPTAAQAPTGAGFSAGTLPQERGDPFLSTPKARAGLTQGQQPSTTTSAPVAPAPAAAESSGAGLNAPWWSREYATAARLSDKSGLELDQMRRANAVAGDPVKSIAMSGTLGPGPTPSPQQQQTSTTPAAATLNSALESQRRRDAINGTTDTNTNTNANTNTNDAAAPPAPNGREVLPGAYEHGRGQYSDNAQGMGFAPGFTGKPSAQNMAVADALDARSQADSMARLQARGFSPGGGAQAQATYDPNAGTSSQWMADLRDPRTLAMRNASVGSKIFSSKGEELMANKARQARVAGVQAAITGQMQGAQQEDTARYQSDNALAGNLGTEQMRQDGENQRSAQGFAVAQQRLGIEAGKEAQESTARGFDILAAQRREGVLQRYDAAKTDQERVQLQRQYPDVFGKESANRFTVVPGGQEWDAAAGAMRNVPARVFNNQMGQFVDQQVSQTAAVPKVGEVRNGYRFKGGNPNDQANWTKV